ncbi:MAG TPA: hypothetical protein VH601_16525 [Bryobacteraceae bacterium]|jgi:hypothetical protein
MKSENIDHVNVKIFAREPDSIDLGDAIPVFHRWIRDAVLDELIIDVADYRHVPDGPGVMLIGDEANYSLDCAFGRLGLLYNRKRPSEGTFTDKLLQAFGSALLACSRLEDETVFQGKLKFDAGQCEVIVNDRLLAPNTEQTWVKLRPEFEMFFDSLLGSGAYAMKRVGESRERFRVTLETPARIDSSLLQNTVAGNSTPLRA